MSQESRLSIAGMACAGCVSAVEQALQAVPGVENATVNLGERTAIVDGTANVEALIAAVVTAGFRASELVSLQDELEKAQQEQSEYRRQIIRTVAAGSFGALLFIAMMGEWLPPVDSSPLLWGGISLVTLLIMVTVGGHFFRGAWMALRNGRGNMDTLITLGTTTAWSYSTLVVLSPQTVPELARHLYFDAALIIIALVSLGAALEMRARGKTSQAIRQLLDLQPKRARVVRNGKELELPLEQVGLDETLRIVSGARIPLDGVVVEGGSRVDESMLTGEPNLVAKRAGDEVVGGTINGDGAFLMRTTNIGRETVLARIIDLVRKAQAAKPEIGRLVDRIAAIFVPVVVTVALVSFFSWLQWGPEPALGYAIVAGMTVLVIACPCALGLATPISIMVAVGRAAGSGMLIRNGEALQTAGGVTTVVLDKTGTVTEGKPRLISIERAAGWDEEELLTLAATLEQNSDHPLASAIVAIAGAIGTVSKSSRTWCRGGGGRAAGDGR